MSVSYIPEKVKIRLSGRETGHRTEPEKQQDFAAIRIKAKLETGDQHG